MAETNLRYSSNENETVIRPPGLGVTPSSPILSSRTGALRRRLAKGCTCSSVNERGSCHGTCSTVGRSGLFLEENVGADRALGVAGISQLPFVDTGLPSAGLLTKGAPRGDACLTLADGDLPYPEDLVLLTGISRIGELGSSKVSA